MGNVVFILLFGMDLVVFFSLFDVILLNYV